MQGKVLYDSGWIEQVYSTASPYFRSGDTLTGVLLPAGLDELVLTGGSGVGSLLLYGPNAPKQNPPPVSHAQGLACGET